MPTHKGHPSLTALVLFVLRHLQTAQADSEQQISLCRSAGQHSADDQEVKAFFSCIDPLKLCLVSWQISRQIFFLRARLQHLLEYFTNLNPNNNCFCILYSVAFPDSHSLSLMEAFRSPIQEVSRGCSRKEGVREALGMGRRKCISFLWQANFHQLRRPTRKKCSFGLLLFSLSFERKSQELGLFNYNFQRKPSSLSELSIGCPHKGWGGFN